MEKKYFNVSTTSIAVLLLTAMGVIIFFVLNTQDNILHAEQNRQYALRLGEELFQSSEDLTRMARTYAVTGNPVYEKYYFDILEIRNGKRPRPQKYFGTYWHLAGIGKAPPIVPGKAVALQTLMRNAGITEQEFALLNESQAYSDELVNFEMEAFAAVKGLYKDGHAAFTVRRAPDSKFATDLLYGEKYIDSKARIMGPIARFIDAIDKRTNAELASLQKLLQRQITALLSLVVISLSGVLYIILQTISKVIQPLKYMAYFDSLTGLVNRSHFLELANQEMARSTRFDRPLSMLMIDIDFFKKINDTYGHAIGDKALQKLSRVFHEVVREIDVACRYGGEEFAILLPETDKKHALEAAERLRASIENTTVLLKQNRSLHFTISIGVTTMAMPPGRIDEMINCADSALYAAKEAGRNRVRFEALVRP